jgi:hypothetical protein
MSACGGQAFDLSRLSANTPAQGNEGRFDMKQASMLAALVAAATLASFEPAAAQADGPWCAVIVDEDSVFEKCDMRTLEQCRTEILSMGSSYCSPNPYYYAARRAEPKRGKTRQQRMQ